MPIIDHDELSRRYAEGRRVATAGREFKPGETVLLGRTSESGLLVVAQLLHEGDTEPWVWFITDCCGASAKGAEDGIICRGCYNVGYEEWGGCYTLEWDGAILPPTAEDIAIFNKGQTPRG